MITHPHRTRYHPAIQRFIEKVEFTSSCWLWGGAQWIGGYGSFSLNAKPVRAHRWSYEFFRGPIPEGLVMDHLCRVRLCVNPDHLEVVTRAENNRRAWDEDHPHHNSLKTSCPRGHDYRPGFRHCHQCRLHYQRDLRRRKRLGLPISVGGRPKGRQ